MSDDLDAVGHGRQQRQIEISSPRVMGFEELDQEARDLAHAAQARISSHEAVCTERYMQTKSSQERVELAVGVLQSALDERVGRLQKAMDDRIGKVPASVIAGLMGLCGWLAARAFPLHGG